MFKLRRAMWRLYGWFQYSFPRGVRNLWVWFPVVWRDQDFDYSFLCRLMEFKLRLMAAEIADHGFAVNRHKTAKRLLMCAALCKRISEGEYYRHWSGYHPFPQRTQTEMWAHESQDIELLCATIQKHLRGWWD